VLAWALPFAALTAAAAVPSDQEVLSQVLVAPATSTTFVTRPFVRPAVRDATAPEIRPRAAVASVPSSERVIRAAEPPVPPATDVALTVTDVAPSVAAASTTETPPVVPPTDDYELDIPAIELAQPVVPGGQAEIDQGHVTAVDWSAFGFPASCSPGDGCTVWLAAHRSTHGAVFARLPELAAGAQIVIHFHGLTFVYTVTSVETVPGTAPPSVIHGDLVLQTSAPHNRRILVYAAAG